MTVYNKILVAVDGSEQSDKAFEKALEIAKASGSDLYVFSAYDTYTLGDNQYGALKVGEILRSQTEEIVQEYIDQAKQIDVQATSVVQLGDARVEIPQYAQDNEIGLVIMGATGKGAIERALVGSVSEYVMRHAGCDVLLVR